MNAFARLLDALLFSPRRNVKLAHLVEWMRTTPDPDRGYGLAALTSDLSFPSVKAGVVRELAGQVTDPDLFALSYDFVGDLAETVALLWPDCKDTHSSEQPSLSQIVTTLSAIKRDQAAEQLAVWMNGMQVSERWAVLKLATGGMRVGVSARLVRVALAQAYDRDVGEIEEIWPLLEPPYTELFDWLDGRAEKPDAAGRAVFHPVMLASPIDEKTLAALHLADWQIEWKWDGARIQLVSAHEGVKLFSRSGDDISSAFPELTRPMNWKGVLDGEILAGRPDAIDSFNALQQRLNRKTASQKLQAASPVFLRFYDILAAGEEDLRHTILADRRSRLETEYQNIDHELCDLSAPLKVSDQAELSDFRENCRQGGLIEGVMIKAKDSLYRAGREKGLWFKWKRDPLYADLVIMYAQRGHGKRSSFYSDYTLGAWMGPSDDLVLVPVCKAYSGFTDAELSKLDKFVREHTTNKFGPVREVEQKIVVEIAFDSLHLSGRHKSGIATRFPRFHAIRWDKLVDEADHIDQLKQLIDL